MSLISCPECGRSVSSLAKHCVHCGCKINSCSECGTVWAGDKKSCPECGYEIPSQASATEQKATVSQATKEIGSAPSNNANYYQTLSNPYQATFDPFMNVNQQKISRLVYQIIPMSQKFLANIFSYLSWTVLAIMCIVLCVWPNSIEMIFRSDDVANACRALVVFSFVFFVLGQSYGAYKRSILINNTFIIYLQNKNIDLKEQIRILYDYDWLNLTGMEKRMRMINADYCVHIAIKFEKPSHEIYSNKSKMPDTQCYKTVKSLCLNGIMDALVKLPAFAILFWAVEEVFMKGTVVGFDTIWLDVADMFMDNFFALMGILLGYYIVLAILSTIISKSTKGNNGKAEKVVWAKENMPDQIHNVEIYDFDNIKNVMAPNGNMSSKQ